MGLFDWLFPGKVKDKQTTEYFQTFNSYTPTFTTYDGGIYEMELTRAAVHSFATLCSKFKPEIQGSAYKGLERILQYRPNPWMDTTKFLYRLATILSVHTTAFILPLYADDMETIVGLYPLLPNRAEVIQVNGEPWLRYYFQNGQKAAIELSRVGILTTHQYKDDFFGDGNKALYPTMKLLDIQRQGIEEGIKQSAFIRFIGRIASQLRPEDITDLRNQFSTDNLSQENKSGLMLYDAKLADVQQVNSKPFIVDSEQMKIIQTNVYNYFGTNESILQNKFDESQFNAFYEGKLEPFAIQLSLVLTNMFYTSKELANGNAVIFTANRLQYASNSTKLQVSSQLFDRGILSTNQIMDIWNLPHVENGDKRRIRLEYTDVDKLGEKSKTNDKITSADSDVTKNDVESVAEDVAGKSLNGAQTQSLLAVMEQFASGALTIGQATNIVSIAIGITKDEAKKIIEGLE